MTKNPLVYYRSPKSEVRHYAYLYVPHTELAHVGPFCIPICWLGKNHRLTLERKGTRLCKFCKRQFAFLGKFSKRLHLNDFKIKGIDEQLCFETDEPWLD